MSLRKIALKSVTWISGSKAHNSIKYLIKKLNRRSSVDIKILLCYDTLVTNSNIFVTMLQKEWRRVEKDEKKGLEACTVYFSSRNDALSTGSGRRS